MTEQESQDLLDLATLAADFLHAYKEARRRGTFNALDRYAKALERAVGEILDEERKLFP